MQLNTQWAKDGAEKITHKSAQRNKDEKCERSIKIWKVEGEITTKIRYVIQGERKVIGRK